MHRLLKRLNKVLFVLSFAGFSACSHVNTATAPIDYKSSTSVLYEVSCAEKKLYDDPLSALARAAVLKNNTSGYAEVEKLYKDANNRSYKNFTDAVYAKNWDHALLYFSSLANIGSKPEGWTEQALREKQYADWERKGNDVLVASQKRTQRTTTHRSPAPELIEKLLKATLTVWVDRGMNVQKGVAYADRIIGSGFFIDERGYFLTNYHVIQSEVDPRYEGYSRVYIKDPNNSTIRIPAKVIGWDNILDVALLKTEIPPEITFTFGSSSDLKVGSKVYAIGSPAGLEKTLTSGIVSAKNRRLLSLGSVLQIDAAINHGNSGGPLIDEYGNVQAIVFAGLEQNEGLNFAIPIELVQSILPRLYAGGQVLHSWFGNFGHTILPAEKKEIESGVVVDYILPQSPAYLAAMNEGDIIQKINGSTITSLEDIHDLLFHIQVKTIIRVEGLRYTGSSYEPKTWFVQLDQRPEFPGKLAYRSDVMSRVMYPLTGMKLTHISKNSYRVVETIKGSSADEIGFLPNDYVELTSEKIDEENEVLFIQVYAKRRKAGYLEGFLGMYAYLDNPSYF